MKATKRKRFIPSKTVERVVVTMTAEEAQYVSRFLNSKTLSNEGADARNYLFLHQTTTFNILKAIAEAK